MYYYFYNNLKVVRSRMSGLSEITNNFVKLTNDEVAFYLNNPNATVEEIKKQQLNPVDNTVDLEIYKQRAIDTLSRMSLSITHNNLSDYRIINALSSLQAENKVYDDTVSNEIVGEYLSNSITLRNHFYIAKSAIETATSTVDVDAILAQSEDFYNNYQWVTNS